MHDDASRRLADDPDCRVMVFIDGQNLYQAAKRLFGHPLCHPHLLARWLAGPRTNKRVACRFYTGRPNTNVPGEAVRTKHLDRRLSAMSGAGVTTVTRPLRYHWDWGHRERLPEPGPDAPEQTVVLRPWQRPQEKGIDLVLALDVIEFALTNECDAAIVVSLDRDLHEIPQALRNMRRLIGRPFRIEAAVPVPDGLTKPKTLTGFAYTHQITRDVFNLVRDDTDYTVADELWVPPILPTTLPETRE